MHTYIFLHTPVCNSDSVKYTGTHTRIHTDKNARLAVKPVTCDTPQSSTRKPTAANYDQFGLKSIGGLLLRPNVPISSAHTHTHIHTYTPHTHTTMLKLTGKHQDCVAVSLYNIMAEIVS